MPLYINIHTHRAEPETLGIRNIRLSGPDPQLPEGSYFSAGVHPWDAGQAREEWLSVLRAAPRRLLAVGETGLDLRAAYAPLPVQKKWFRRQIEIANQLHKPLIIHNVRATQLLQTMLREQAAVPVVLHGFTGTPQLARQWLGTVPAVRFSFGPTLLQSPKTQEALRWIATEQPDRLFLETDDDPTLSIRELYGFAARRIGWEEPELRKRIELNFNDLFPTNIEV